MKISSLLLLCCFYYYSVYDVRGNVRNILEEFQDHFKKYVNQKSSNLTCIHLLKNLRDPCPCVIEQLQKIDDFFQNQNSTEVVMMKMNLQALIDHLMKSGKSKDQTKQPGKRDSCKFMCWIPITTGRKIDDFFSYLNKHKCFKGLR